jgi:hypothetical protein
MNSGQQPSMRGGLVISTRAGRRFVPAEVAVSITLIPGIVPVAGLVPPAVGIAMTEDRVVTVLSVGEEPGDEAIVCEVDGGWVALNGGRVLACGRFNEVAEADDCIDWNGEVVESIDLAGLLVAAETAIWRARGMRDEGLQK